MTPDNAELLNELSVNAERLLIDDPELETNLRDAFGMLYLHLGDAKRAEAEYQRHLQLTQQLYGKGDGKTLRAYDMLIDALHIGDKLEESELIITEALLAADFSDSVIQAVTHDPDSYGYALRGLRLRHKLAETLHKLGNLDDAELVYRETLSQLEQVLSHTPFSQDNHDNVAEVRWGLAKLLFDRADSDSNGYEETRLMRSVVSFHNRRNHTSWEHASAQISLARAFWLSGMSDQAISACDAAQGLLVYAHGARLVFLESELAMVRSEIISAKAAKQAE